jgi:hypothetical protein
VAKLFWQKTKHPLAMAMLGSFVCKYVASKVYVGWQDLENQAAEMEGWVVDTLKTIPEQSIAHSLLGRMLTDNQDGCGYTLLDLAMFLGMKRVMAQRYCQSLMDSLWRGQYPGSPIELPPNFTWSQLLLETLVPILNRRVFHALVGESQEATTTPATQFYSALSKAQTLRAEEMIQCAQVAG